jgi:uncharacterized protein YegP (UPF0339 family)
MSTFVISKRYNGDYKFVFASRKGKTIFTSIACKHKSDCERMILGIKENMSLFAFTKVKKASNKFFFRLSKDGLVLANSRKFSTELMLQKGIDEIINYVHMAEILDFSENELVFSEDSNAFEENAQ